MIYKGIVNRIERTNKNMAQFDSPLGKKTFKVQPMKQLVIPDGAAQSQTVQQPIEDFNDPKGFDPTQSVNPAFRRTMNMPQINQSIQDLQSKIDQEDPRQVEEDFKAAREAKKAKLTGKERLSENAKKRIEMLLGMTRVQRNVDIGGNIFVLQILSAKAFNEALCEALPLDNVLEQDFEMKRNVLARAIISIAGVDTAQFLGTDELDARLEFLGEIDQVVFNRLYDEYIKMREGSSEKYAIKNEAEMKEVIEDLKK
jgi:hypothetical protein